MQTGAARAPITGAAMRFLPRFRLRSRPLLDGACAGALLWCAISLAPLAGAPAVHVRAPSLIDVEIDAFHVALDDLRASYFGPVDTRSALASAWDAAVTYAQAHGASGPPHTPRPAITDRDALARFDAALRALAAEETAHRIDERRLGEAAIAGLASSVHENHTYYISPEDWAQRNATGQRYAGIGVTISQVGEGFYISEVFANSPADNAGLQRGDRLLAVDRMPVPPPSSDGLNWLVQHLRGEPGTSVSVGLSRQGAPLDVQLTRAYIYVPDFEAKILDGDIGYLRVRAFPPAASTGPDGKTIAQALDDALARFDTAGTRGWVLDLRNDGGGYLDAMTAVASRFLAKGTPLFVSRTRDGESTTRADGPQHLPARPLVVIINAGTASAAEILAAALQENGRALIIGQKSAGVANAANRDALPDGGGISITVVQSLTPLLKRPLDGQGVLPNEQVEASADDIPRGADRQLDRAKAILRAGLVPATAATH